MKKGPDYNAINYDEMQTSNEIIITKYLISNIHIWQNINLNGQGKWVEMFK